MFKSHKGTYGYIKRQTVIEILKTVFMILICAGTYYIGIFLTKSNQNLLTFVAILGCLPMAKFFVNAVLFIKARGCSDTLHDYLISNSVEPTFWDLYFTAYKSSYQVSALYYNKGCLIGITEGKSDDIDPCEKHLNEILKNCGISNVTVKIFDDKDKFIERYQSLKELTDDKDNTFLYDNILGVSI